MLTELLSTPTTQLGKASRFLVFQIKLWPHCVRLLKKNRSGQQAAALAYHTIFGIVPLAIVTLLIFQSFPAYSDIGDRIKTFAYDQLQLDIEYPDPVTGNTIVLTDQLDSIVDSVFKGLKTGTIALFGAIVIIWAALGLLSTTERAFNNIWHVGTGRNFLHRMINYWALLTLGPLLIGAGVYITTRFAMLSQLQKTVLPNFTSAVLSYLVSTIAFFLLYFVLPNTRVKAKSAIWGAAVAALVWSIAKWGFGYYVIKFVPYGKVYGVMGLIPLFVFWIYITWMVVLFGLQLTFTTQHLSTLDAAQIDAVRKPEDYFIANDLTAINIVREIAAGFELNNAPVQAEIISSKLNIPAEFTDKILSFLVTRGIIIKTSDPKVGFAPAQDPANIKLADISDAVAAAGFAQSPPGQPENLTQITDSQRDNLAKYNVKQILGIENTPS